MQAIKKFARLRRPVYVTETGIADRADSLRAEWAASYFKAVCLASKLAWHTLCLEDWILTMDFHVGALEWSSLTSGPTLHAGRACSSRWL